MLQDVSLEVTRLILPQLNRSELRHPGQLRTFIEESQRRPDVPERSTNDHGGPSWTRPVHIPLCNLPDNYSCVRSFSLQGFCSSSPSTQKQKEMRQKKENCSHGAVSSDYRVGETSESETPLPFSFVPPDKMTKVIF